MESAKGARSSAGKDINWESYGLCNDPFDEDDKQKTKWGDQEEEPLFGKDTSSQQELYHEDQAIGSKPWWKANFFLSEPVLFGTWDGVFTSCMINLFSVIVFLRTGWIVGNAGIIQSILILVTTVVICTIAALAAIAICERCSVETGGVHFLLSHILGARTGGAVSLIYCLAQAVSCALHVMGFAESVLQLFNVSHIWIERTVAVLLIILLMGINIAGVKWVIRLQFVLLIILLLAALDLAVGSLIHVDPEHGVVGYDIEVFQNNTKPQYLYKENWFTMFGVFFPAMTGILAGVNMSGDLRNPSRDIPVGTLSSVGTSFFLYLLFVLCLGATCHRWALQTDFMIAEKVSATRILLLAGLYISSMSACLGSLYASPRIIQSMASENVIPVLKFLKQGKGPNKVPVRSLIMFSAVTVLFILIGQINTLAPIVTIPFLLTYAVLEYSYFSLAMTFDMQQKRESRFLSSDLHSPAFDTSKSQGVDYTPAKTINYGTTGESKLSADLDQLFPERVPHHKRGIANHPSTASLAASESPLTSPDEHSSVRSADSKESYVKQCGASDILHLEKGRPVYLDIGNKSRRWYSFFCNRWVAVLGAAVKLVIMFLVQWGYALSFILTLIVIWFYIGQANPGTSRGIAEFRLFPWIKHLFSTCLGCKLADDKQMVVTPGHPGLEVLAAQLTEDNVDYACRERYHHSTTVKTVSHLPHFDSD